ncbi:MAG: STN domain-containing protein [Butyricimonas faecihominis]
MKKKRNTWYRYGKIPCKKSLCIMRLTLLLMIGFVFQLSATGVAQSVKIEKQHQTLETVFEQVESQTGLLIMFSNNELDVNRKITLDVRKYTLNELFRKVLEGTNMDFDLEQNYVIIRPPVRLPCGTVW